MIAIIDYEMGNVGSIQNMLRKLGKRNVIVTHDESIIEEADKIILPGVGAFDMGMEMLEKYSLIECLNKQVLEKKKPIMGICLGMQMLGKRSEEGKREGLGFIDFNNVRLRPEDAALRVPHMGWDYVKLYDKECKLVKGIQEEPRYYFVHSYYAVCKNKEDILMSCRYGGEITAAVRHENIYGTQFHPEKSHKYGMLLMKNFVEEC